MVGLFNDRKLQAEKAALQDRIQELEKKLDDTVQSVKQR
jgi:hypothetical protein